MALFKVKPFIDIIKPDPDQSDSLCWTCLASGRRVCELGRYKEIYCHIMRFQSFVVAQDNDWLEAMRVCWECAALLRRVAEFHSHVLKARDMLEMARKYGMGLQFEPMTSLQYSDINAISNLEPDTELSNVKREAMDSTIVKPSVEIQFEHITDILPDDVYENDYVDDYNGEDEEMLPHIKNEPGTSKPEKRKCKKRKKLKKKDLESGLENKQIGIKKEIASDAKAFEQIQLNHKEMVELRKQLMGLKKFQKKQFKCDICIQGFFRKEAYLRHVKKTHSRQQGMYMCDICPARLTSKFKLTSHIQRHYFCFKCKLCDYAHVNRRYIDDHVRQHDKEVFLQCLKCDMTFHSRAQLLRHYKVHSKYECDICRRMFTRRCDIESHMLIKHNFDGPRKCNQCNKTLANTIRLRYHVYRAHKLEPLELRYCVECNKTYTTIENYKTHCKRTHGVKQGKRFSCPVCEKFFAKKCTVLSHIKAVHYKKTDHYCPEHDKYFFSRCKLKEHIRVVHDGFPVQKNKLCPHCGRGFSDQTVLGNHIRTHTGEKPFSCPHCTSAFSQKSAMTLHVKNVHMKLHKQRKNNTCAMPDIDYAYFADT